MPKNNQFSVLCSELIKNCPEKVKNYPEKNLPKSKKFLPRKENLPNTCSPANDSSFLSIPSAKPQEPVMCQFLGVM